MTMVVVSLNINYDKEDMTKIVSKYGSLGVGGDGNDKSAREEDIQIDPSRRSATTY